MIETIQQAFEKFELEVARVPDKDNAAAKAVHPEIRDAVAQADTLTVKRDFLSGSYGRKTQSIRLNDIDVIIVLADPEGAFAGSARNTLHAIKDAVTACDLVRRAHVRQRAVKAFLHDYEFTVDIVPALKPADGKGLLLACNRPEECVDLWTLEYPEQQLEAAREKNTETGGLYVPATRVIKSWNQRYETVKPLRSYHAESMLYHSLTTEVDYADVVVDFFDHAYHALQPGQLTPTPGVPGRYVDEQLDDEDHRLACERIEQARELAYEAAALTDPGEAMDAWVKVFGAGFPAPSTNPDALDKALREGKVAAAGAGIGIGTSSKSRPIIPGRSWRRS